MRALPDLSPLAPFAAVYDPVADDFTQLLSDQPSTLDSLQQSLDPAVDQSLADLQTLSDAVDAVGGIFDGIDGTFAQLNGYLQDLDYEQIMIDTQSLEQQYSDAVDAFNPDVNSLAQPVIDYVLNQVAALLLYVIDYVIAAIADAINYVIDLVYSILAVFGF